MKCTLPKLTPEEIENLDIPVTKEEISVKTSREILGLDYFTSDFYQTFKEELIPILNLFKEIEEDVSLPDLLCEASTILTPKAKKDIVRNKNYRLHSL